MSTTRHPRRSSLARPGICPGSPGRSSHAAALRLSASVQFLSKLPVLFTPSTVQPPSRAAVLVFGCKACLTFSIPYAIMQMSSKLYIFGGGDLLKNRIEEIRNAKGLRQEELAKAMGVSRQTISSLENGRYNPSILLAYKIARYFDLTIEEVFIFEEE